ncbi:HEAT repeat domain-containing protein [Halobaculum litoreum]|uniref:HEAT repeat domain-containing protein n=1 Tax=Halobaculum litoreum TaxID=3031998 RepID=A0ABD5XNH9_9EURY
MADDAGPVRRNALIALAKLDAVAPDRLRERLKRDRHPPVREYAAEWLGERPGDAETTVRVLAAVLARDGEAFVRANAASSLGEIGSDRAVEALETQGLGDRSDDVQRAAKRALATARGEDPDEIDLGDPPAPGGGPDTPAESPASGAPRSAVGRGPPSGGRGGSGPIGRGTASPPSTATRRTDRDGGDRR